MNRRVVLFIELYVLFSSFVYCVPTYEYLLPGYYTVNPNQLSESYEAVETPVEDIELLGSHIAQACQDYPVYKLHKLVGGSK